MNMSSLEKYREQSGCEMEISAISRGGTEEVPYPESYDLRVPLPNFFQTSGRHCVPPKIVNKNALVQKQSTLLQFQESGYVYLIV